MSATTNLADVAEGGGEDSATSLQVDATAAGSVPLPGAKPTEQMAGQPPAAGDQPPATEQETANVAPKATGEEVAPSEEQPAQKAGALTPAADSAGDGSVATAAPQEAAPPKKTGLFAFFASNPKPKPAATNGAATPTQRKVAMMTTGQVARSTTTTSNSPEINMAALDLPGNDGEEPTKTRRTASDDGGLPGVRQSALFEIKRRSGVDDDSDVDIYEDAPQVQLASAAGMARAPNGLLTQHEDVDVGCLKPALVRLLKQIEARYGRKLVVTSGYRSPAHNRRARGAKNSQHMYCAAADVQMPGVSKWELAKYARNMPGRGGVGTYCHTESIHIDVGPNRDWNWRCRGRRKN